MLKDAIGEAIVNNNPAGPLMPVWITYDDALIINEDMRQVEAEDVAELCPSDIPLMPPATELKAVLVGEPDIDRLLERYDWLEVELFIGERGFVGTLTNDTYEAVDGFTCIVVCDDPTWIRKDAIKSIRPRLAYREQENKTTVEDCEHCGGTGKDDCKGTGRVDGAKFVKAEGGETEIACPRCFGAGGGIYQDEDGNRFDIGCGYCKATGCAPLVEPVCAIEDCPIHKAKGNGDADIH